MPYAEDQVLRTLQQDSAALANREVLAWARTIWWAALYIDDVIRTQTRLVPAVAAIVSNPPAAIPIPRRAVARRPPGRAAPATSPPSTSNQR